MSRIAECFAELKAKQKSAFIPYIMAGDPSMQLTLPLMQALCAGGADMLELGVPFSDPTADGVAIQQAGLRALKNNATLKKILALCGDFRLANAKTPIILMGYANVFMQYSYETFAHDAAGAGVDGVIVVDLPPEEEGELQPYLSKAGVDFVRLIAPTTHGDRLKRLCETASGFVYSINIKGITGSGSADSMDIASRIAAIRECTDLPIVSGFGIKTSAQVQALQGIGDGVVVGSALVEAIYQNSHLSTEQLCDFVSKWLQELKG
jgi:tryptophan synthase alpha chain